MKFKLAGVITEKEAHFGPPFKASLTIAMSTGMASDFGPIKLPCSREQYEAVKVSDVVEGEIAVTRPVEDERRNCEECGWVTEACDCDPQPKQSCDLAKIWRICADKHSGAAERHADTYGAGNDFYVANKERASALRDCADELDALTKK